jgi:hypothetical protein
MTSNAAGKKNGLSVGQTDTGFDHDLAETGGFSES